MSQSDLSKLERRRDVRLSTLRAYAKALGGRIETVFATDGERLEVQVGGEPARNIYAAGEIMAGNILRKGYIAGVGMTIGTVFGRIAGEEAARHATR